MEDLLHPFLFVGVVIINKHNNYNKINFKMQVMNSCNNVEYDS